MLVLRVNSVYMYLEKRQKDNKKKEENLIFLNIYLYFKIIIFII